MISNLSKAGRAISAHSARISWRSIHLTALKTPNPASIKFFADGVKFISSPNEETIYHTRNDLKVESPFIKKLFENQNIFSVLLAENFITITVDDNDNEIWEKVHKFLSDQIDDFSNSNSGFAVQLNDSKLQKASEKLDEDESELMKQVNEIIDAKIRPFLQEDGGDITILSAENGIVKLKFRGACHGCPSSEQTLNHGINNLLKYYLPEITEVIKVDDELEGVQLEQFEKLEDSLKNRK